MLEYHTAELDNRLACAWAAFFKFKGVFCDPRLPLKERLQLFESLVTPCALYGSGAWTMTAPMVKKLQSTWRRMLRWMLRAKRRPQEDWVAFVQRTTHWSEDAASDAGLTPWPEQHRLRVWRLAGRAVSASDGRWTKRLLAWRPWFRALACRHVGRALKRWDDLITQYAGGDWVRTAADQDLWKVLQTGHVQQLS